MKFVFAVVVLLAVAMGVQSSLVAGVAGLGYGVSGLGYGAYGLGHGVNGIGLVNGLGVNGLVLGHGIGVHGHGVGVGSAWLAPAHVPAAVNIVSSPAAYAVSPHAAIAAPLAAHGATYVAKTRGAVHTAPLAGHIKSAASINVAPAPGTL